MWKTPPPPPSLSPILSEERGASVHRLRARVHDNTYRDLDFSGYHKSRI